jgi:predicted metalloprotease with PDZ domain
MQEAPGDSHGMIAPRSTLRLAVSALALLTVPAFAQTNDAPTGTSMPQPAPLADTIPPPKDVPYPGTIKLAVDATDTDRGIFRVTETIPVQPGHLVLLYPKWLPGNHSPTGQISKVAGLVITAGGKTIPWKRDPVDVFAFHLDVPSGVDAIEAKFQYLSPTAGDQGRTVMTPEMLSLQWNLVALYPAGYFVRQIMVSPSATYPDGWTSATALRPSGTSTAKGGTIQYETVAFDTLVDSPTIAGRYARIEQLSPDVTLDILADRPDYLQAKPEQIAIHKALIVQATRLFGAQHYNHYDFLFTLSGALGGIGLEHHRSSEDGSGVGYFKEWDTSAASRDILAHEFTHSWNGKFRRPADLWTPDYRQPMGNSLLWVYEGQTQFWGNVLAARSGLTSREEALDQLAAVMADYANQAGKQWRPLEDTTLDPIIARRAAAPWSNWQRSEDYYREGQLIWLEADSLIRERSKGKRSLDDFAKAFFGMRDRDWGEYTYTFDDVVATLNKVEPYDWATFLHQRIDAVAPQAPLESLARGGYRLVYTDQEGSWQKSRDKIRKAMDLSFSVGLSVGREGKVSRVMWDSPAFNAGITNGATLIAINGHAYNDEDFKQAIRDAKGTTKPITLLVRQGDYFRTVSIAWNGGLRYPHLEKIDPKAPSSLDALYTARK